MTARLRDSIEWAAAALVVRCEECGGRGGQPREMHPGDREWAECTDCHGTGRQPNRDRVCVDHLDHEGELVPAVRDGLCATCVAERDVRVAS